MKNSVNHIDLIDMLEQCNHSFQNNPYFEIHMNDHRLAYKANLDKLKRCKSFNIKLVVIIKKIYLGRSPKHFKHKESD